MNRENRKLYAFTLPPEVMKDFSERCKANFVSMSQQVVNLILEYLRKEVNKD